MKKKVAIVIAVAAIVWIGIQLAKKDFGIQRHFGYGERANSYLHGQAADVRKDQNAKIRSSLSDRPTSAEVLKAAKMNHAAAAEQRTLDHAIDNVVKSCPSDYKYDKEEGKITFDVTECDKGQIIWLGLFNEYKAQVYSVTLYKYGRHGTENVQVAARPVIKVMSEKEPDGFSLATPLSGEDVIFPFDYTLRGKVKFVPIGNADLVEMVLRK